MKQLFLLKCFLFVISMAANVSTYANESADVNGDGTVDVADIASIITVMSGEDNMSLPADMSPEGTEAIDLGLPSGTKWANMNVGAESCGDDGLYFSWGDIMGYARSDERKFSWSTYKWRVNSKYNKGDGKIVLDVEDDAARANWGGQWSMPNYYDFSELMRNTTWKWEFFDGAWGRTFTSKINDNSIFLPAEGYRDSELNAYYFSGYYWSKSLNSANTSQAYYFYFRSDADMYVHPSLERYYGCTVRPIIRKTDEEDSDLKTAADVNGDGTVDVADIAAVITRMAELARQQQTIAEEE